MRLVVLVDPSESMRRIPMHMSEPIWDSPLTHQNRHLVGTLRSQSPEVPDGGFIVAVGNWIPFLSVDEIWELDGVPNKEDRSVVSNHIPVAFLSVELDGEPPWVPLRVSSSSLSGHGREPRKDGSHFPNGVKDLRLGIHGDICSSLEEPMGSRSLSVHNSLWNSLPIKVRDLVNKVEILQHNGAIHARRQSILIGVQRHARGGSHDCTLSLRVHLIISMSCGQRLKARIQGWSSTAYIAQINI